MAHVRHRGYRARGVRISIAAILTVGLFSLGGLARATCTSCTNYGAGSPIRATTANDDTNLESSSIGTGDTGDPSESNTTGSKSGRRCRSQADCAYGRVCLARRCVVASDDLISYTDDIHMAARPFLDDLKARQLNVVTAESLTSGMIVSSLVDVPLYGAYVYGGFATYDSDAKRLFLGVKVGDVYTEECALEMTAGALTHSRALVGVAVTGKAGPVAKTDLDSLGVVDVAVSIRTNQAGSGSDIPVDTSFPQTFTTVHQRINVCEGDGHQTTQDVCDKYKLEAAADPNGFSSPEVLSLVRQLIRQDTVIDALVLGRSHLDGYVCDNSSGTPVCPNLAALCPEPFDGTYSAYGEPSSVIQQHLGPQCQ